MDPLVAAAERGRRLYGPNAFRRAYVSGAAEALAGGSRESCSYRNRRGWGSAYRKAWFRGFDSVAVGAPEG